MEEEYKAAQEISKREHRKRSNPERATTWRKEYRRVAGGGSEKRQPILTPEVLRLLWS